MDRSQLYNQIAGMLKGTPGNNGTIEKTHVASVTPQGSRAQAKSGMAKGKIRSANAANPNKTYTFDIINKTRAKMGN